jgi:NADH-quinone oxidoreductase subunit M
VLAAWYLLDAVRKMLQGPTTKPDNAAVLDLNWREILTLVPILILFFVIGLFPNLFFDKINPSAQAVADALNSRSTISMVVDVP